MNSTILVIIFLAIPFGLIVFVVATYNHIISLFNSVERGWSDVIAEERKKNNIIPAIEGITNQFKDFERDLQTSITKLRSSLSQLSDSMDYSKLSSVESNTQALLKSISVAVENYPDLKSSTVVLSLMREISEQQENIAASIRIFNKNVQDFNTGIQVFPASLINSIFARKNKIVPFYDSNASSGFEYSPNIQSNS